MTQMLKHVGKFGEKPCILVMRSLPNDPAHCLITQTVNLPNNLHDELMAAVQSSEAQASISLAESLQRKTFSDGEAMLNKLHYNKYIQKVPVSMVTLTPAPNQEVSLEEVNNEINKIEGGYTPPKTDDSHLSDQKPNKNSDVSVDTGVNSDAEVSDPNVLLERATVLEEQAKEMRKEAKSLRNKAAKLKAENNSSEIDDQA